MTVIEELEQVVAQNRAAMVARDWGTLQATVEQMDLLADRLATTRVDSSDVQVLRRIRSTTSQTANLANRLSDRMSKLLNPQKRGIVYSRRGQVGSQRVKMMHLTG